MTNRERADKIARLSQIAVGSPAKVIEIALDEAEARGRAAGLKEALVMIKLRGHNYFSHMEGQGESDYVKLEFACCAMDSAAAEINERINKSPLGTEPVKKGTV